MFLKLEDGTLVNTQLIDRVEFNHKAHARTATLWAGGVVIVADSRIAYLYYSDDSLLVKSPEPKPEA